MQLEEKKINGEKIAMLRGRKEWSQRQLGEMVGLTQAGVNSLEKHYRAESGTLRSTSVEKAIRLAEVFDVSLDYLCDRTDDPRPPAQLAQLVNVVADTPEQKETLRSVLESAKKITSEELRMVAMLLRRLSETVHAYHTKEATEAAQMVDRLPEAARQEALNAIRSVESNKIDEMKKQMEYLLSVVSDVSGKDARVEVERRFKVRLSKERAT